MNGTQIIQLVRWAMKVWHIMYVTVSLYLVLNVYKNEDRTLHQIWNKVTSRLSLQHFQKLYSTTINHMQTYTSTICVLLPERCVHWNSSKFTLTSITRNLSTALNLQFSAMMRDSILSEINDTKFLSNNNTRQTQPSCASSSISVWSGRLPRCSLLDAWRMAQILWQSDDPWKKLLSSTF